MVDGTRLRVNDFLVKTDWSLSSSLEREVTSQKIHASSPSASEIHTRAPDSIVCWFSGGRAGGGVGSGWLYCKSEYRS